FERNNGQADLAIRFIGRSGNLGVLLTDTEIVVTDGKGQAVRLRPVGSSPLAQWQPMEDLGFPTYYFNGNDPRRWRERVPSYGQIRRAGLYPSIDLVFHGTDNRLEYDFVVGAGVDPGRIRIQVEGGRTPQINAAGDLIISTEAGDVVQRCPSVYQ